MNVTISYKREMGNTIGTARQGGQSSDLSKFLGLLQHIPQLHISL